MEVFYCGVIDIVAVTHSRNRIRKCRRKRRSEARWATIESPEID